MALIIPEVFADAVNAKFSVKLRAANLATDMTDLVPELSECGDTVHFPTFDEINDAATITKGTPMSPEAVNMSDNEAEIKQVGKAVRIYDRDSIQVKGSMKDRLAEQVAYKMAKAVDSDLVAAIKTDATYSDDVTGLTQADVEQAFEVFGDDIDNDVFAGILIHSGLKKYFMAMDNFINSTKTFAVMGNGEVKNGVIGYWNGSIPVYVSDNGTQVTESNVVKKILAIVKKDALAIAWQRVPMVEESREALLKAWDIVADELYATKLVDAGGVSVLKVANPS
jgi:hypothetical protein